MPELGLDCNLYVYLPPDYNASGRSYPVIYAQDGVELFDDYESLYNYECKMDETLNKMAAEGYEVPIVVATSNWDDRNSILSPWDYTSAGVQYKGAGKKYIEFLINTLKPYIDSAYRTLPGRENTGIIGASLGGLISFYAAIRRPDVFSKAGIYSPSYWVSDSIWTFVMDAEKIHPMRMYQLVGSDEGEVMVNPAIRMNGVLSDLGFSRDEITFRIVEGGVHHNSTWGPELRRTLLWLFPEQPSSKGEDNNLGNLAVYPNPARSTLHLDTPLPVEDVCIRIYNLTGEMVKSENFHTGNQIDVATLPPGIYMLRIAGNGINYWGKFVKE